MTEYCKLRDFRTCGDSKKMGGLGDVTQRVLALGPSCRIKRNHGRRMAGKGLTRVALSMCLAKGPSLYEDSVKDDSRYLIGSKTRPFVATAGWKP